MDQSSLIITVIVVLGFTALLSFKSFRQKQSSWQGRLINKQFIPSQTDDDSSSPEKYRLTFLTDQGHKISLDVFEKDYNSFAVGDKARKNKGDNFPVKSV